MIGLRSMTKETKLDPTRLEELVAELAPSCSSRLLQIANAFKGEADFRREAAKLFEETAQQAGVSLKVRDEFRVAQGRVDAVYNKLIIEYEHPGSLRKEPGKGGNSHAVQQVKDYILGVAKKHRREVARLAGVAMDGNYFIFVRRVGDGWVVDEPMQTNTASTAFFLRLLFSLSVGAALVPENLIEDFGPKTLQAQRAVRALYRALHGSKQPLVLKLFEQWRMFFSEATDYKEWAERIESKEEFRSFVKGMGLDPRYAEAPKVFFALHTYYALLIKLIASLVAARFADGTTMPLSRFVGKSGEDFRKAFLDLERGGLFREYGIRNFLEGDFFGWYLTAWNEDIEEATGSLVHRLADYDPGTLELAPENARDLLKKLYHYLLPREIRHDLGEYYTPDWLAERLIIQTLGQADLGDATKRVLDPACGSGTFLIILIKYIRERLVRRGGDPAKTLELILRNVVGFDLNPLAVIAARTNYLLALGELLKARKGDIDIPVYQADSVLTPSRGSDLFTGNVYPLKTSVGEFRVPAIFAEREGMDILANELDQAVETGIGEDAFLHSLGKSIALQPKELQETENDLSALYRQLHHLHEQGLNGVWARIIKNAFAPLFIEPCDCVVGNPPWVNWEHLPDEYRRSTMPLWDYYNLFPKREKAMETILGAAKYDISMLMTYVAVDRYLRRGGKLGFVLSQSLFKSSAAGQGFRRFILPDGTSFGPLVVEDMVELKPFEGAANRTVVAVFSKGRVVRYPVSYQYWRKRGGGRGSSIGFDTPYEEVTKEKITFQIQHAVPIDPSDPTSAWLTAKPKSLFVLHKLSGRSEYVGRKGVTCSVNGVFWISVHSKRPGGLVIVANVVERAKKEVASTQAAIEADLIYPLVRGRDVSRWHVNIDLSVLLTHKKGMRLKAIPEDEMKKGHPKTWGYLTRFEAVLRKSGIYRRYFKSTDPFYSVFNIGDYTFAPHKVVVREIAGSLTAAVIGASEGKPCIPDHKLIMVECSSVEEAHFLCALLNSAPARLFVGSYVVSTQFSTHIFDLLAIPRFTKKDAACQELARHSVNAHEAVDEGNEARLRKLEEEIDCLAAKVWGLTDGELAEIKQSLRKA